MDNTKGKKTRRSNGPDSAGDLHPDLKVLRSALEDHHTMADFKEHLEKGLVVDRLIQKYADELRAELVVDSVVVGVLVREENPHILGIKESLAPGLGLGTRLVRHKINLELAKVCRSKGELCLQLGLFYDVSFTISDRDALRANPEFAQFCKLDVLYPERAYLTAPLIYNDDFQGLVVCSQLDPRQWDAVDCGIIKVVAGDISHALKSFTEKGGTIGPGTTFVEAIPLELPQEFTDEHRLILNYVERGLVNKQIVKASGMTYSRVRYRIDQMMEWSNSATRGELVYWARRVRIMNQ